ncbi:MAG: hypothetical protein AB3N23_16255 [Paracoccaceae bacterium]
MYRGDSFHTLSAAGQVGLAALSLGLAVLTLWAVRRLTRGQVWPIRLGTAVAAIWLFDWLSPQVYYLYYMTLFDIPAQIVIRTPIGPLDLLRLLSFSGESSLSAHSRGALGLACMATAFWPEQHGGRHTPPQPRT